MGLMGRPIATVFEKVLKVTVTKYSFYNDKAVYKVCV